MKASGQVLDAIPGVARAMLYGGTAELVTDSGEIVETEMIDPAAERAVAPEQKAAPKKPKARSGR